MKYVVQYIVPFENRRKHPWVLTYLLLVIFVYSVDFAFLFLCDPSVEESLCSWCFYFLY